VLRPAADGERPLQTDESAALPSSHMKIAKRAGLSSTVSGRCQVSARKVIPLVPVRDEGGAPCWASGPSLAGLGATMTSQHDTPSGTELWEENSCRSIFVADSGRVASGCTRAIDRLGVAAVRPLPSAPLK
jgi:hypothetical protein